MRLIPIAMLVFFALIWEVGFAAEGHPVRDDPIESGLEWLVRHQEPDGHWDSVKYSASKKTDTAATSLALLAFLDVGYSERTGQYKGNVKRAVAWLKSKQDSKGRIFDTTDDTEFPNEACGSALALLAMAEAAAMSNIPETRAAALRAVNYCTEIYPLKRVFVADEPVAYALDEKMTTPIVGWYVMAMKTAKVAGLHVEYGAFDPLILYLDSVEHKLGKARDEDSALAGEYWYRKTEKLGDGHPLYRVSAIGCLCRQSLGWTRDDLRGSVEHFVDQGGLPNWTKDAENVDLYYWYVGTLAVFHQNGGYGYVGGVPFDDGVKLWKNWYPARNKALGENQCKTGDEAGSWNAQGYASREWGRVGQTALACLCLGINVY